MTTQPRTDCPPRRDAGTGPAGPHEGRRFIVRPLQTHRPQGLWVVYDRRSGHRFGRYATAFSAGREAAHLNLLGDVRGQGTGTLAAFLALRKSSSPARGV